MLRKKYDVFQISDEEISNEKTRIRNNTSVPCKMLSRLCQQRTNNFVDGYEKNIEIRQCQCPRRSRLFNCRLSYLRSWQMQRFKSLYQ